MEKSRMHLEAKRTRDPFAFSLRGMAVVNSFVPPSAVPLDGINRARDARREASGRERQPGAGGRTRRIEAFLARYFAPGCPPPAGVLAPA
ncbi:MAG: hypothetical protein P8102_13950 [Gammaproteobacteria bacterium]